MAGRLRASGVVAGVLVLLAGTAAVPAAAEPAFSCGYRLTTSWPGGFVADIDIVNNGPAITGWTVRMTFKGSTSLLSAWRADITQSSPFDLIAKSLSYDETIPTGGMQTFGWTATSTDTGVPTAVTVNGTTC